MRIVVTGASGLLGSSLAMEWSAQGHDVTGIVRSRMISLPGVRMVNIDLTHFARFAVRVRRKGVDWIVNCAAFTDVDGCEREPKRAHQINTELPGRLARFCAAEDIRFLQVSTDSVFDGRQETAYDEQSPACPVNWYATTKLEGERRVQKSNPDSLVLRTNFFGWNVRPSKVSLAEWVVGKLRSGESITGFTDVKFNPLYTVQAAGIFMDLMKVEVDGLYHVGASESMSKHAFAVALAQTWGFNTDRIRAGSSAMHGFRARRPRNTTLACGRVQQVLDQRLPSIVDGINKFRKDEQRYSSLKSEHGG